MFGTIKRLKNNLMFMIQARILVCVLSVSLILSPSAVEAQTVLNMPAPGTLVMPSVVFTPPTIAGMTINPQNPLEIDFIVDTGDDFLKGTPLERESKKLINYFLASLTVPEDEMWVNLSPHEKNRISTDGLAQTEMGRDMLAQDYLLKQFTASLMYPEEELGEKFWKRIRKKAKAKFGTTEIPTNTFNKVWIIPDKAVVYVNGNSVFVSDSHLKVMLEEDYLGLDEYKDNVSHGIGNITPGDIEILSQEAKEVVRQVLIPEIEREINSGKNFANLRQIYNAMILAAWYKKNLKSGLLAKIYMDQNKTSGIDLDDKQIREKIYAQYLEAFKKGVYNYIREETDEETNEIIPRKYFSGGALGVKANLVYETGSPVASSTMERHYDRTFAANADEAYKGVRVGFGLQRNDGNIIRPSLSETASPVENERYAVRPRPIDIFSDNDNYSVLIEVLAIDELLDELKGFRNPNELNKRILNEFGYAVNFYGGVSSLLINQRAITIFRANEQFGLPEMVKGQEGDYFLRHDASIVNRVRQLEGKLSGDTMTIQERKLDILNTLARRLNLELVFNVDKTGWYGFRGTKLITAGLRPKGLQGFKDSDTHWMRLIEQIRDFLQDARNRQFDEHTTGFNLQLLEEVTRRTALSDSRIQAFDDLTRRMAVGFLRENERVRQWIRDYLEDELGEIKELDSIFANKSLVEEVMEFVDEMLLARSSSVALGIHTNYYIDFKFPDHKNRTTDQFIYFQKAIKAYEQHSKQTAGSPISTRNKLATAVLTAFLSGGAFSQPQLAVDDAPLGDVQDEQQVDVRDPDPTLLKEIYESGKMNNNPDWLIGYAELLVQASEGESKLPIDVLNSYILSTEDDARKFEDIAALLEVNKNEDVRKHALNILLTVLPYKTAEVLSYFENDPNNRGMANVAKIYNKILNDRKFAIGNLVIAIALFFLSFSLIESVKSPGSRQTPKTTKTLTYILPVILTVGSILLGMQTYDYSKQHSNHMEFIERIGEYYQLKTGIDAEGGFTSDQFDLKLAELNKLLDILIQQTAMHSGLKIDYQRLWQTTQNGEELTDKELAQIEEGLITTFKQLRETLEFKKPLTADQIYMVRNALLGHFKINNEPTLKKQFERRLSKKDVTAVDVIDLFRLYRQLLKDELIVKETGIAPEALFAEDEADIDKISSSPLEAEQIEAIMINAGYQPEEAKDLSKVFADIEVIYRSYSDSWFELFMRLKTGLHTDYDLVEGAIRDIIAYGKTQNWPPVSYQKTLSPTTWLKYISEEREESAEYWQKIAQVQKERGDELNEFEDVYGFPIRVKYWKKEFVFARAMRKYLVQVMPESDKYGFEQFLVWPSSVKRVALARKIENHLQRSGFVPEDMGSNNLQELSNTMKAYLADTDLSNGKRKTAGSPITQTAEMAEVEVRINRTEGSADLVWNVFRRLQVIAQSWSERVRSSVMDPANFLAGIDQLGSNTEENWVTVFKNAEEIGENIQIIRDYFTRSVNEREMRERVIDVMELIAILIRAEHSREYQNFVNDEYGMYLENIPKWQLTKVVRYVFTRAAYELKDELKDKTINLEEFRTIAQKKIDSIRQHNTAWGNFVAGAALMLLVKLKEQEHNDITLQFTTMNFDLSLKAFFINEKARDWISDYIDRNGPEANSLEEVFGGVIDKDKILNWVDRLVVQAGNRPLIDIVDDFTNRTIVEKESNSEEVVLFREAIEQFDRYIQVASSPMEASYALTAREVAEFFLEHYDDLVIPDEDETASPIDSVFGKFLIDDFRENRYYGIFDRYMFEYMEDLFGEIDAVDEAIHRMAMLDDSQQLTAEGLSEVFKRSLDVFEEEHSFFKLDPIDAFRLVAGITLEFYEDKTGLGLEWNVTDESLLAKVPQALKYKFKSGELAILKTLDRAKEVIYIQPFTSRGDYDIETFQPQQAASGSPISTDIREVYRLAGIARNTKLSQQIRINAVKSLGETKSNIALAILRKLDTATPKTAAKGYFKGAGGIGAVSYTQNPNSLKVVIKEAIDEISKSDDASASPISLVNPMKLDEAKTRIENILTRHKSSDSQKYLFETHLENFRALRNKADMSGIKEFLRAAIADLKQPNHLDIRINAAHMKTANDLNDILKNIEVAASPISETKAKGNIRISIPALGGYDRAQNAIHSAVNRLIVDMNGRFIPPPRSFKLLKRIIAAPTEGLRQLINLNNDILDIARRTESLYGLPDRIERRNDESGELVYALEVIREEGLRDEVEIRINVDIEGIEAGSQEAEVIEDRLSFLLNEILSAEFRIFTIRDFSEFKLFFSDLESFLQRNYSRAKIEAFPSYPDNLELNLSERQRRISAWKSALAQVREVSRKIAASPISLVGVDGSNHEDFIAILETFYNRSHHELAESMQLLGKGNQFYDIYVDRKVIASIRFDGTVVIGEKKIRIDEDKEYISIEVQNETYIIDKEGNLQFDDAGSPITFVEVDRKNARNFLNSISHFKENSQSDLAKQMELFAGHEPYIDIYVNEQLLVSFRKDAGVIIGENLIRISNDKQYISIVVDGTTHIINFDGEIDESVASPVTVDRAKELITEVHIENLGYSLPMDDDHINAVIQLKGFFKIEYNHSGKSPKTDFISQFEDESSRDSEFTIDSYEIVPLDTEEGGAVVEERVVTISSDELRGPVQEKLIAAKVFINQTKLIILFNALVKQYKGEANTLSQLTLEEVRFDVRRISKDQFLALSVDEIEAIAQNFVLYFEEADAASPIEAYNEAQVRDFLINDIGIANLNGILVPELIGTMQLFNRENHDDWHRFFTMVREINDGETSDVLIMFEDVLERAQQIPSEERQKKLLDPAEMNRTLAVTYDDAYMIDFRRLFRGLDESIRTAIEPFGGSQPSSASPIEMALYDNLSLTELKNGYMERAIQKVLSDEDNSVSLFVDYHKEDDLDLTLEEEMDYRGIAEEFIETLERLNIDEGQRFHVHVDAEKNKVILVSTDEDVISASPLQDIQKPGGIDFNPELMELEEEGNRIEFIVNDEFLKNIDPQTIQGIVPVIIHIAPITNLPLLLGFKRDEDEIEVSALN